MPLTALTIKSAKPKSKTYKLPDGKGLLLEVTKKGSKRWRYRYYFEGKEKMISFGLYPEVSLQEAREKRFESRKLLSKGINPSELRQSEKLQKQGILTFKEIAQEWFTKYKPTWTPSHAKQTWRKLENHAFPTLAKMKITEITPQILLRTLKKLEERNFIETAHRLKGICGQIFSFAVASGQAERDITYDLKKAISPKTVRHHPTITDPKKIGVLLRSIDQYEGRFITKCALQLAPLTFVRPGELRQAQWKEINFETSIWEIPAQKMKAGVKHFVPLSRQSLEVLEQLHSVKGSSEYVFPGIRTKLKCMSNMTINNALRRMGYEQDEMTGHGFRSMASTLLNEQGWKWDAIERQLAHAERNGVRAAYNYAEYMDIRVEMMQAWADFLDKCKEKM